MPDESRCSLVARIASNTATSACLVIEVRVLPGASFH
jgi:hypothetical protein